MSDIDLSDAQAAALAGEYEALYAYGLVGARVTGTAQDRALKAMEAHTAARDSLRAAITAGGGTPAPSDQAYQTPAITDSASAAQLAASVEQSLVRTYSALAAAQPTGEPRTAAARTAQECALRAMAWGAKTSAFPG